ncbi:MAG: replication initiation ATPase [Sphingomonas bacterium]|nr:DnaA/Hda family protein [Sphingomonas bacterium]MDB5690080.1 replication initiation ATPase [Sphingomonas bacterium]
MSQFALPLDWPVTSGEGDFLVGDANAAVLRHLKHWALWPVMATIVTGPRKSGRSLLARRFVANSGGTMIDDADRVAEEALFHAWNRAQSERRPLLLIADAPPPAWQVALPDLRSRISATPKLAIAQPDDTLAAAIIEKLLGARGLATPPEVLAYLVPRIDRSYVGIQHVVDMIDETALARRSRLTVPLARSALIRMGVIDDSC